MFEGLNRVTRVSADHPRDAVHRHMIAEKTSLAESATTAIATGTAWMMGSGSTSQGSQTRPDDGAGPRTAPKKVRVSQ